MVEYLQRLFQAYYKGVPLADLKPAKFNNREFAFIIWNARGMIRHKGFFSVEDYKDFLIKKAPIHVYYSAALYNSPWKDRMDLKDYKGCDLIFDIDCDHIETACKQEHDSWICKDCGKKGKGPAPRECPKCSNARMKEETWLCDECLEVSKTETRKLVDDFLVPDFGLGLDELEIYFSGHRGYHVHVEVEQYLSLTSDERREISDYITSTGINIENMGFFTNSQGIHGFKLEDPGWRGKLANHLLEELENIKDETTSSIFPEKLATLLGESYPILKKRLIKGDTNWTLQGIKGGNWNRILKHLIDNTHVEIDVPVTIDVHRLIRAPSSLHGKTGFKICKLERDELDGFDPFLDPIVFRGNEETVKIINPTPPFRVGENAFGPYEVDEPVSLPLEAAVYLLCKKKAVVME